MPEATGSVPRAPLDPYRAFVLRLEAPLPPTGGGSLEGTTLAVKDNIAVGGLPCRAACPALPDAPAPEDAPVVAALRAAGAAVAGLANMHELALGVTSDNPWSGRVENPRLPEHLAGGSSGGTAAAIAAGLVDAGLGTDTGGSVRIPAAWCGIAGLRPTTGRYPGAGIVQLSSTFDTAGPMAPTVVGVDRLDAALVGRRPAAPATLEGLRLAVHRPYFYEALEPSVARAMEDTLARLRDAGCALVELELPGLAELIDACHLPIVLPEIAAYWRTVAREELGLSLADLARRIASADVRAVFERLAAGDLPSEVHHRQALERDRPRLRRLYAEAFARSGAAAFVAPCTPIGPPRVLGPERYGFEGPLFATATRNTLPASCAALPSVCLPVPVPAAAPVGLLLDGRHGEDERLLSIALAVEALAAAS